MKKKTIGQRIKDIRLLNRMSQADLERKTGIKREYLSKIENNILENQTVATLRLIADGLGVSLTMLIADSPLDLEIETFINSKKSNTDVLKKIKELIGLTEKLFNETQALLAQTVERTRVEEASIIKSLQLQVRAFAGAVEAKNKTYGPSWLMAMCVSETGFELVEEISDRKQLEVILKKVAAKGADLDS